MYSYKQRTTVKYDITKTSCTVVISANNKYEIAAEGNNIKVMTKYILHIRGTPVEIEASKFYDKISITGLTFAE